MLVRRSFEVMRELVWREDLEPKCRAEGLDAGRIKSLHEAWHVFSEARDWEWWQEDAAKDSDAKLQAGVKEAMERMEGLKTYSEMLVETASCRPANDKDMGMER